MCGCPCDEEGPGGRAQGPEGGHVPPGRIAGLMRTARPLQCTEAPWRTGAPGQRTRARAPGERPCWVAGCRGPADGAEKPRGWILSARSRGAQRWPGADCGSRSPVSPLAHDDGDGVGLDAAAGCLEAPCGVSHARKNIPRRGRRPRPCGRADVLGFCVVAGPVSASSRGLGVPSGNAGLGRMSRTTSGFFPETEVPVGRLAPCHSLRHSGV